MASHVASLIVSFLKIGTPSADEKPGVTVDFPTPGYP